MRVGFVYCPIHTLGPGRRFGLWLQGCSRGCPDCISPELQPRAGGMEKNIDDLSVEIISAARNHNCTGVTISGGEPFEQGLELGELCGMLHSAALDILIYTGFHISEILGKHPWVSKTATCVVDGPFLREKPTEAGYKGSDNQRAWIFARVDGYREWLGMPKKNCR